MNKIKKQLIKINNIFKLGNKNLLKFGKDLFTIAKSTSQNFDNVSKIAQEFSKQGLGAKETLRRTKDTLILARISGLSIQESINRLTTAINSFTNKPLNTTKIINKLAVVDAKFAVSSKDLADAISRVGNSAVDAGVSFDQLLASVALVAQTTGRSGAVIGNSLKTIFTRVGRPETLNNLRKMGILTHNSDGKLPIIDILINLAKKYPTLPESDKAFLDMAIAGIYQI